MIIRVWSFIVIWGVLQTANAQECVIGQAYLGEKINDLLAVESDTKLKDKFFRKEIEKVIEAGDLLATIPFLNGLNNTLTDFIPVYSLISSVPLVDDRIADPVGIAFNPDILFKDNINRHSNFLISPTLNADPKLLGPLEKALRDAGRFDEIDRLKDKISKGDDLTYAITYNPKFWHFSRDWVDYAGATNNIVDKEGNPIIALNSSDESSRYLTECIGVGDNKKVLDDVAEKYRNYVETLGTLNENNGIHRFADLVFNQPQVVFQGTYLDREEIVNASIKAYKITFEMGLANLMMFDLFSDEDCMQMGLFPDSPPDLGGCGKSYAKYVNDNFMLNTAARISFGFKYSSINDISVDLQPALGETTDQANGVLNPLLPGGEEGNQGISNEFSIPGTDSHGFILGYSMYLTPIRTIADHEGVLARLNVSYEREQFGSRLFRNDRDVFNVTVNFSYGPISVPLTVIQRSDSEFKNDLDTRDITYMLGLNYSFIPKKKADISAINP